MTSYTSKLILFIPSFYTYEDLKKVGMHLNFSALPKYESP